MLSQKILLLMTLCSSCLTIYAGCVCEEKGIDYCGSCIGTRIIKPKPRLEPGLDLALPPIGDNCWCSKMLIQPAVLPKPPCPKHKSPTPCGCPLPAYGLPSSLALPRIPLDNSLPADPISVSLAIQAGKAIAVPEAKLAYGFVQKPIDDLKKIFISNIPEEKLFALKNEIITLKKPARIVKPEEEEYLDLEEEEEAALPDDVPPLLTYRQLGYIPEQFKNPKFKVLQKPLLPTAEDILEPVPEKLSIDCGFKPGRILPCGTIIKPEAKPCY